MQTFITFIFLVMQISLLDGQSCKTIASTNLTNPVKNALAEELNAFEASSANFSPAMRAFTLFQIGQIEAVRMSKSTALARYRNALTDAASTEIPAEQSADLQTMIARAMLDAGAPSSDLLSQFPQFQPTARLGIARLIVERSIGTKDFTEAEHAIAGAADHGNYPFDAAAQLLRAYPPESVDFRRALFFQALLAFNRSGPHAIEQENDFGALLVSSWHSLPPDLVLDGIQGLLSDAEKADHEHRAQITTASASGVRNFDSAYQYRLGQVLPILQTLDEAQAKKLSEQNPGAAESAKADSNAQVQPSSADAAVAQLAAQVEEQQSKVFRTARTDPPTALEQAAQLPLVHPQAAEISPRADALASIAHISMDKDPNTAKSALKQLRALGPQLQPWGYVHNVRTIAEIYSHLGDDVEAIRALNEALPIVKKLYALDIDRDDPNLAPKQNWPSTFIWSELVLCAATISPDEDAPIIQSIPDPEVGTLVRIRELAHREKVPLSGFALENRHKQGSRP